MHASLGSTAERVPDSMPAGWTEVKRRGEKIHQMENLSQRQGSELDRAGTNGDPSVGLRPVGLTNSGQWEPCWRNSTDSSVHCAGCRLCEKE